MNVLIVNTDPQRWGPALERASHLLHGPGDRATLVHIIPRAALHGQRLPVWDEWDDLQTECAQAKRLLQEGAHHLRTRCPGLAIQTQSTIGDPQEVLTREVAAHQADVILLNGRLRDPDAFGAPTRAPDAATLATAIRERGAGGAAHG